MYSFFYKYPIQ